MIFVLEFVELLYGECVWSDDECVFGVVGLD